MMRALLWANLCLNVKACSLRRSFISMSYLTCPRNLKAWKNNFYQLVKSNEKLANDLKSSNSLEDQLKKVNDENLKFFREVQELKNFISKLKKEKRL